MKIEIHFVRCHFGIPISGITGDQSESVVFTGRTRHRSQGSTRPGWTSRTEGDISLISSLSSQAISVCRLLIDSVSIMVF